MQTVNSQVRKTDKAKEEQSLDSVNETWLNRNLTQ